MALPTRAHPPPTSPRATTCRPTFSTPLSCPPRRRSPGGVVPRTVVARGGWDDVGGPCGCQAAWVALVGARPLATWVALVGARPLALPVYSQNHSHCLGSFHHLHGPGQFEINGQRDLITGDQ